MVVQEFLDQFDIFYNNITSNQAPGLDSYEKSVFLTKAQDEVLKSYFDPKLNKSQEGFDGNEKRQIDFSNIIKTTYLQKANSDSKIDSRSNLWAAPSDVFMILNEKIEEDKKPLTVLPLSYAEYNRLMNKPYKKPLKHQAWRLINNGKIIEVITGSTSVTDSTYICRYLSRPKAIVLEDFSTSNLSINGNNGKGITSASVPCELDPILHPEILQRGIEIAKAAWQGGLESQLALGINSGTNMGYANNNQQENSR